MVNHHARAAAFGIIAAFGLTACAAAADWPQFLGPQDDGVAHDAPALAHSWPVTGPKILWRKDIGPGFGGPAIYGDSVLLLDRDNDKADVLRRFNLADGNEVWRYAYPAPGSTDYNGSRSTPATDGNLVFSIGPHGQISAVKFSDGSLVWKKNLLADWSAAQPQWACSTSPLLCGDWVIVMPWGKKAALAAYEKSTGNVVWTTPNPRGVDQEYESPILTKLDGRDVILATGKQGALLGADARTGEILFTHQIWPEGGDWWEVPSPVAIGDGRIFFTCGYGHGSVMIKVQRQGQQYRATQLWANRSMGSKCAQALLYNGHLYGNSTDDAGGLRCITLDGVVKWDSTTFGRAFDGGPRFELGNLIIADGLIYIINGMTGALVMAEASPDGYKQLGRAQFLTEGQDWAPMAFANGKLVVRDYGHSLVCLDVTAAGNGVAAK